MNNKNHLRLNFNLWQRFYQHESKKKTLPTVNKNYSEKTVVGASDSDRHWHREKF